MPAVSKLQYYLFSSVHEKCAGWLGRLSYQVTVLVYGNREGTPSQLVFHHGHIPIQTKLAYPIMSTDIDSAMSQPLYCQSVVAGAQFT